MTDLTHPLRVGDVARLAKLSCDRIVQLDDELEPERAPNGHRRYSVARVQSFLSKRAKRQGV